MFGKPDEKQLAKFLKWCVETASEDTCRQYVNYLRKPLDMNNKWSRLAWKKYFKFLGNEDAWKAIKVKQSLPDLKVPSVDEVLRTLRAACKASEELCLIYKLLIESGARLSEVVKMLNEFNSNNLKEHNGFFTYALGYVRGSKFSFYIFSITRPKKLKCSANWISNWASKNGLTQPKYVRKLAATVMASLEIPESVINFIQGRVPRGILERNYLSLYSLALKFYPRYAGWVKNTLYSAVG